MYPCRPLVRGRDVFTNGREECAKRYKYLHTHSPELFTVQIACLNPELLGVAVMGEIENIYNAMNALIARFDTLTRIAFFDNACTFALSVALRLSGIFEYSTFSMGSVPLH